MTDQTSIVSKTATAGTNWAGNYSYTAKHLHQPHSVAELQEVVGRASAVKALGARHSFNAIADTAGDQISLEHFNQITLNPHARTVTVGAGITYGRLCPWLNERGFAIHNLASLPHLTVVGACTTGTHGSGAKSGNLSTAVTALEFVASDGELVSLSRERDGDTFAGAVVSLGGIGVITNVTLKVEPAFSMAQLVYENLPFAQIDVHFDKIFSSAYSVSLFTDWQSSRATQLWLKRRIEVGSNRRPEPEFFGARLASKNLHPIAGHEAEHCTEQMGIPGPWHERLPHFRMDFTPSSGNELQSEYFVPRDWGAAAIRTIEKLGVQIAPHLLVSEIRVIDGDDLWMSPCYRRPSVAIHFTWKQHWAEVQPLLTKIEESLAPFAARPHWGKLFTMRSIAVQRQYERLPDFRGLLRRYDPAGKFRNEFLRIILD